MPIYSHSRLSSFEQCPLKYKFAYVDGIKRRRTSIEAFMGSRFHEVLEQLYKCIASRIPTLEELLALYDDAWQKAWSDDVFIVNSERSASDFRLIGRRAIEDYHARYHPFDQGRVLGLERELLCNLSPDGRHRLRCILDRLMGLPDGSMEIHDYKTSARLPEQAQVDADRQLALYEIAVRSAWPDVPAVELVWHYVACDRELRSRRTPEERSALAAEICALIDRIEATTEFPPCESNLCSWCDFRDRCPLFAHDAIAGEPPNPYEQEEGAALVNIYAALEEQKGELSTRIRHLEAEQEQVRQAAVLKAHALGVSRLFGLHHALTIRPDLKVHYPKKGDLPRADFEACLHQLGLWEQVQDFSWSAFKALAKQGDWTHMGVPSALAPFVQVEVEPQVRLSRKKGDDSGEA